MTPHRSPPSGSLRPWYLCAVALSSSLLGCASPPQPTAPPLLAPASSMPDRPAGRDALEAGLAWIVAQAKAPDETKAKGKAP